MDGGITHSASVWPGIFAIWIAVFVPLTLWCVVAFRKRDNSLQFFMILAAVQFLAFVVIAILAHL